MSEPETSDEWQDDPLCRVDDCWGTAEVCEGHHAKLGRRIAELQETLRLIQWGSCDGCTMPGQFCPQCKNREEDGHTAECFVGQALK